MLTAKQFYKAALFLLLVAPLLASLLPFTAVKWVLMFSLLIGGLPCLPLLFYLWFAVNRAKTPPDLRKVIYKAPLLFLAPVFIVVGLLFRFVPMTTKLSDWTLILSILGYALLLGYAYVLLTQALYRAGCRLGWVLPWEDAADAGAASGEMSGGG